MVKAVHATEVDLTDEDHLLLQKAELVAGYIQTVTRGPEEGLNVLINATVMLCRIAACGDGKEPDLEILRRQIGLLVEDWQDVYNDFDKFFPVEKEHKL